MPLHGFGMHHDICAERSPQDVVREVDGPLHERGCIAGKRRVEQHATESFGPKCRIPRFGSLGVHEAPRHERLGGGTV